MVADMSTLLKTPAKKPAKPVGKKAAKKVPTWIGSGEGMAFIKPGVDLTKPTLPPGKYL